MLLSFKNVYKSSIAFNSVFFKTFCKYCHHETRAAWFALRQNASHRALASASRESVTEERSMRWLHKLRISTKIYLLVGFLSVVAGLVGSVGIIAMRTYDSQVDAMTAASTRA